MDYFELNVINPDNRQKKGNLFEILSKCILVLMAVAAVIILILMPWQNEGLHIFYNILIILMIELPLFGAFIIVKKVGKKYYDLDYFILGDTLKIVKIINGKDRKSLAEINLCDISEIGLYGEKFKKKIFDEGVEIKKFICNPLADCYLYAVIDESGGKYVCILEYDDRFLMALRKALKREMVFDKELLKYSMKRNKEVNK